MTNHTERWHLEGHDTRIHSIATSQAIFGIIFHLELCVQYHCLPLHAKLGCRVCLHDDFSCLQYSILSLAVFLAYSILSLAVLLAATGVED
jgi:hypothetical protein